MISFTLNFETKQNITDFTIGARSHTDLEFDNLQTFFS